MTNRIQSLDAARGFTVLIMPAVHTVMLYSKPDVYNSWFGYILAFMAEGPGAQLFMFLMGFSIAIGREKSIEATAKRSLAIWAAGYVLNLFRMVIPATLHLLPDALIRQYTAQSSHPFLSLLLTGDILQMAGIAFAITMFVYKARFNLLLALALHVTIIFLSPFLWGMRSENFLLDHLLALVCAHDHRAFFPLFPWLCYPLAGLATGILYKDIERRVYTKTFLAGLGLLALGFAVYNTTPKSWEGDFYRSSPGRSLQQTGFVLLWICLMQLFVRKFYASRLSRLLAFCSRHITLIYIIQWILISWGTAIVGYQQLNLSISLAASLITTAITLLLAFIIVRTPIL